MRILLLSGKDVNSQIVLSFLLKNYNLIGLIEDIPVKKQKIITKRMKRLGVLTTLSQLLFITLVVPFLKLESKKRKNQILEGHKLSDSNSLEIPSISCSINDEQSINFANKLSPDVIVVNGTRIISSKFLETVNCPIINIHVGITPKYRGVHGGYWALVNRDLLNLGVTVHLVDLGIDTGSVLIQKTVNIQANDNFITYPILQTIKGLDCLDQILKSKNFTNVSGVISESKLYHHPTIFVYFKNRLLKGVK